MRARISLLWAAIALCSLAALPLSAAGSKEKAAAAPTSAGAFDKKLDLHIFTTWPNDIVAEDAVRAFLEKKFNATIKLSVYGGAEYMQPLKMRIAAGDFPDYFRTTEDAVYKNLYDDKLIVNISDYVAKYGMANLKRHFERKYADLYKEADGFYQIPVYTGVWAHAMFIRKDWVDKLGLKMPATYQEYRNVLQAFVKNDPDGKKTAGLTSRDSSWLYHIICGFTGIYEGWTRKTGDWTFYVFLPEFREAMRYLAGLYKDGLLDPEFAVLNTAKAYEKIAMGKAGSIMTSMVHYEMMNGPLQQNLPGAVLSLVVPFPAGTAGPYRREGLGFWSSGMIAKAKSEEVKVRVLALLDYINGSEGQDLMGRGIEGVHYQMKDGKVVRLDEMRKRDFQTNQVHIFANLINQGERMYDIYTGVFADNVADAGKNGKGPEVVGLVTDKTRELDPNINGTVSRWYMDFITGKASVETQWDAFLKAVKDAGVDDYKKEVVNFMKGK
jgi:putative aldouronate transport system substrate-binding protein